MNTFHDDNENELLDLDTTIKKRKKSYKRSKRITVDDSQGVSKADINYLRGQIRLAFTRSDYKASFLASKKLFKPRFTTKGKRHKVDSVYWICAHCGSEFKSDQIEVDHIKEVSLVGVFDLDNCKEWINALYCGWDNLQVLCIPDHDKKTADMD